MQSILVTLTWSNTSQSTCHLTSSNTPPPLPTFLVVSAVNLSSCVVRTEWKLDAHAFRRRVEWINHFEKTKTSIEKKCSSLTIKKQLEIKWEMNMSYPHSAPLCTYVLIMTWSPFGSPSSPIIHLHPFSCGFEPFMKCNEPERSVLFEPPSHSIW